MMVKVTFVTGHTSIIILVPNYFQIRPMFGLGKYHITASYFRAELRKKINILVTAQYFGT